MALPKHIRAQPVLVERTVWDGIGISRGAIILVGRRISRGAVTGTTTATTTTTHGKGLAKPG